MWTFLSTELIRPMLQRRHIAGNERPPACGETLGRSQIAQGNSATHHSNPLWKRLVSRPLSCSSLGV